VTSSGAHSPMPSGPTRSLILPSKKTSVRSRGFTNFPLYFFM
jgi:hypothetical protein